jgi:hypothetical protein
MTRKTERDEIGADLATVEALLGAVPEGDILGRRSLDDRCWRAITAATIR